MTAGLQEKLPQLYALAHDHSEAARVQLAGQVADLFLSEGIELSESEDRQLNELIDLLLRGKNQSVRAALVEKFSNSANLPRSVALKMANEPCDVAQDILINNEKLTDEDLITVVEVNSRDHARFIALRKSISEAVVDALITTGDFVVMQTVAENLGAKLSPKVVMVLAEAARLTSTLQRPVMLRPELTEDVALKLYWWVAQDLRRAALQRFGINAGRLDSALAKAVEEKLSVHILEKGDDFAMDAVADWLAEREVLSAKLLPQILRMGHFRLFCILLSRLTQLGPDLIEKIVTESGGRLLAALCRAIGVDKANFVSVFLLSRGARPDEQIVHPRELSFALVAYDRVTQDMAQNMIDTWRADPSYLLNRGAID